MKKQFLAILLISASVFMGQAFAGPLSLQGSTVTGSYSAGVLLGADSGYTTATTSVTEDALAPEYFSEETLPGGSSLYYVDFDFAGVVAFYSNGDFVMPTAAAGTYLMTFVFSGLTEKISGFSLKNADFVSNADKAIFSVLSDNSVSVDLSLITGWDSFAGFTAQLAFAPLSGDVPEPTSITLLCAALLGMGLTRRRAR